MKRASGKTATLLRLAAQVAPHRSLAGGVIGLLILSTLATVAGPRFLGLIIDRAMLPRSLSQLYLWAGLYAGSEIIRLVSTTSQNFLFARLGQLVMQDLRSSVFSRLLRAPVPLLDRQPSAQLVSRLTNDISALAEMFTSAFADVISKFVIAASITVSLIVLDVRLAAWALGLLAALLLLAFLTGFRLHRRYRRLREELARFNEVMSESLGGIKTIKLFSAEEQQFARLDAQNEALARAQYAPNFVMAFLHPAVTLINALAVALLLWYGARLIYSGALTVGVLVTALTYVLWLFWPVLHIIFRLNVFLSGLAAAERVFQLLDWPGEEASEDASARQLHLAGTSPKSRLGRAGCPTRIATLGAIRSSGEARAVLRAPNCCELENGQGWPVSSNFSRERQRACEKLQLEGALRFENVWFAYQNEDWVLRDVAFDAQPGEHVAIVGPTGSGKSTIFNLLLRFYAPQRGSITLDGLELAGYAPASLRGRLGLVEQSVALFSGSIKDNIALFEPDFDAGGLRTFAGTRLGGMAERLDLNLSERGGNLSAGERQTLAFLRAWNNEPDIWLLDEAAAHLDPGLEAEIHAWLRRQRKTVVAISHRLQGARLADRIIVLHKGHIVEQGGHEELLKKQGFYWKLWRLQTMEGEST